MSTKFHVNDNGDSGPCGAGKGNNPRGCPFGGASGTDNHFDTIEEAKAYSEEKLSEKYGKTTSAKSNTSNVVKSELLDIQLAGYKTNPEYRNVEDDGSMTGILTKNTPNGEVRVGTYSMAPNGQTETTFDDRSEKEQAEYMLKIVNQS